MPDIQILSPHLADLIAAGEVVERPASVVKELVENAFDAGARTVTVELRGGGATYLRVTDDGCGMAPEDAGIAFLRHATSKLHDEQGLEAIGTMGFRGEALAAISAVSHITLTTRQRGAAAGTHITLDAGDIQDMYETGCPEGTTMIVRDLFFNTPARRKFLKSDRAEGAACAAAALRCALGRPDVSVRCIRDGEEVFFSPGDNKLDSCVYSLLGRDLAMSLLPCAGEADGVRVHGFISSPAAGRGSRAQQYFFCNGRWIRSAALQAALEQAYRNTLLVGRFPACVLYIELSCAAVDVNVHPAKTEVKFTHERAVFDAVYYGARAALEAEKAPVTTLPRTAPKPEPAPKADPFVPSAPKAAPAAAQHPPAPAAPTFAPARTYAPAAPAEEETEEPKPLRRDILGLVVGAVAIAVGANLLVDNGTLIAQMLGVPESVIALTFVALGTSLPELVTAITSLVKGHNALSLGNVIGANLFNLVLVCGVSISLNPFTIPQNSTIAGINASLVLDLPVMWFVMLLLTVPALLRGKLSRVQGIILLAVYATFCVIQFAM